MSSHIHVNIFHPLVADLGTERGVAPEQLRSIQSTNHAFIRFRNVSSRTASVYWIDYTGAPKKFNDIPPSEFLEVNTFESHPWVIADADSGDRMVVNGSRFFMPVAYRRGVDPWPPERMEVKIDCPVYSLEERCIQVLRDTLSPQQLRGITLPTVLKQKVFAAMMVKSFWGRLSPSTASSSS